MPGIRFHAWSEQSGQLLAEAPIESGAEPDAGSEPLTVVTADPGIVGCSLVSEADGTTGITDASFSYVVQSGAGSGWEVIGGLGGGALVGRDPPARAVYFAWPGPFRSLTVSLSGKAGSGKVDLDGPGAACVALVQP